MAFLADKETIRKWLLEGINKGATHCLIICDTWDLQNGFEDFPKYVMPGEDVREIASMYHLNTIEFIKEIYNLKMDIDKQLKEKTSMNY